MGGTVLIATEDCSRDDMTRVRISERKYNNDFAITECLVHESDATSANKRSNTFDSVCDEDAPI